MTNAIETRYGKENRAVLRGFGYLHPSRISQQHASKHVKVAADWYEYGVPMLAKILSANFVYFLEKSYFLSRFQILIRILQPFQFHCTFHLSTLVNFLHTSLKFCILVRNFQYFPRFQNEDSIEKFLLVSEVSYF